MGFHDVQFPLDAEYGSQGGDGWNTGIIELDSGTEERVARWSNPKRSYDVSYAVKTRTVLRAVLDFFNARQGAANSFRFRDWMDYASTADGGVISFGGVTYQAAAAGAANITNADQQIGTGNGTTTTFQLVKKYTSGSQTYTRNITKPVSGSLLISFDTGAGPVNQSSGFSVDTSTGIVTFTTAPANGTLIRAGFVFDVEARFSDDTDKRGIRWQFSGGDQVGTDAIVLVEVPSSSFVDEDDMPGGSADLGVVTASFTVNLALGRVQRWTVNTASLNATMPDGNLFSDGDRHLFVVNDGSQSIQVKRSNGTNEFVIAAGAKVRFVLVTQTGAATGKRWYGF